MKKIFFYIFSITVFLQGCSMDDSMLNPLQDDKVNFPVQSQELGKAVAKELRGIVTSLNEMGVDYSDADGSPEFKQRFYGNLNQTMSPNLLRSANAASQTQMSPEVFMEKVKNLTELQIKFVERIIDECEKSTSYDDFTKRLLAINKDIASSVPDIQQERLFNVTAVLYYGMGEIENLEKQGQMLSTPYNGIQPVRLKSGNESGGGWGANCRKFLATVWVIAVGEPTPAGEIVASVITVVVGGILLYEVITCSNTKVTIAECTDKYENCMNAGGPWSFPNSGGWGKSMCNACYEYCLSQNMWDCPRPV